MNFVKREIKYPSSDGINTVCATIFAPKDGEIRGIVQLSHGMTDYVGRYEALADFLTEQGFIFAGNEHLGHGRTAAEPSDLGYFAKKDGYLYVLDDLKAMNTLLHEEYPNMPVILFGHSMGSFLARLYAEKFPETISALVIHGTGGKNPAAPAGRALVSLLKIFFGSRHRSKFVTAVAFGSYNSRFPKEEGNNAWLTRDVARVASRDTDPYCNFIFTLSGYHDLFTMLIECNAKRWFDDFPKSLPTLVMSGLMDPVGDYGKGVMYVHDGLKDAGVENLSLKTYEGARHELFNEFNMDEAFADLLSFLEAVK